MATKKLKFTSVSDMFGTTINLQTRDKSYNTVLVEGFNPIDPLKNQDKTVTTGYLFRSPDIRSKDWEDVFLSLSNTASPFNLTAEVSGDDENRKINAWIRFSEKDDAAIFAWTNVDKWQKWSDDLEKEARKEAKKGNLAKIKVGKDGKITAKVTVTTLGK